MNKEIYRLCFDLADVILVILNARGKVEMINRKGCELLGCPVAEIIGQDWFDNFVPPADRGRVQSVFGKIMKGEMAAAGNYVNPVIDKAGRQRLVAWRNDVLRDEQGNITASLSSGQDITDQTLMIQNLRDSEESFRALAEESPNMIFINHRGRVVYANKQCEATMGYRLEEFTSPDFDFLRVSSDDSLAKLKVNFAKHLRGGDVPPIEYRLRTKDGHELDAILSTKLIKYDSDQAILGVVTDVSQLKKAEAELKEKIKELELINDLAVGRELKMVSLEKEVNGLLSELGRPKKY